MTDRNQLKPGWKVWRFDQMATNVNVRIDNPSESGMEHYVGLEHLDPDSLRIRRWGSPDDVEATKLMFKKGDIIFGRRRAYQRKLGVAEFDGICSAHAMVLRAKPEVVLPEFLPYFMQSDLFMNRAVEISVGSLSPTINWKTMAIQEFALPSISEQKELVIKFQAMDEAINKLGQVVDTAEKLKQSLANQHFMTQPSIQKTSLVKLCEIIRDGTHAPPKRTSEGPLLLGVTNLIKGRLQETSEDTRVSEDFFRKMHKSWTPMPGDVLLAIVGATIGKTAIVPEQFPKFTLQRSVAVLRGSVGKLDNRFLRFFLASSIGQRLLWAKVHQTAQPGLYLKDLGSIELAVPSIDRQREIVEQVEQLETASDNALSRRHALSQMRFGSLNEICVSTRGADVY
ncbi:restriction endonuclease subunit S [Methylomonas sp. EFPC3]|uniref:restriction endonuclease subunit S n=1 Tax=Methylomonas sp. EFPC3 TaxID=3021710 RepID=UPI00241659E8|nr:restriction endonuclease subunit S [Methylomonas sp. EFPC3]WFP49280.1 restriction endonuclease subunit S [Methylomonas sp. EFPC3]